MFVSLFRFPSNATPELGIVPSRWAWDFHDDDDADKLHPGDEEFHKRIGNDRFLSKKDGNGDVIFATNGTDEVKKDRRDVIIEEKDGSLNELFARSYMEAFDRLGAPIPDIDFMAPWRRLKGQIFDR